MFKVIATVAAIISSLIAITLYTATVPAIQKQAEDNSAAIETLGGSVSDNAEAIETLSNVKIYEHFITIESYDTLLCVKITSKTASYTIDTLIEYLYNNQLTTENDVIPVTGRHYWSNGNVIVYGLYALNDDIYAVALSSGTSTPTITSYLIENLTLTDISVLIN